MESDVTTDISHVESDKLDRLNRSTLLTIHLSFLLWRFAMAHMYAYFV